MHMRIYHNNRTDAYPLAIRYRKATAGAKTTCRICKRRFYPEKLRTHRRYVLQFIARVGSARMRREVHTNLIIVGRYYCKKTCEEALNTYNLIRVGMSHKSPYTVAFILSRTDVCSVVFSLHSQ